MIRLTLKRDPLKNLDVEEEFESLKVNNHQNDSKNLERPKLRINLSNPNPPKPIPSTAPTLLNNNNNNLTTLPHTGLEEQFILRLPPSLSSILKAELSENEYTSPGDLSIKFISPRTAIVKHPRFIKEAYGACLVDSPTIMETLKSSTLSIVSTTGLDEKEIDDEDKNQNQDQNIKKNEPDIYVGQYYKVADLNQILMVLDLDTIEGQRVFNRIPVILQEQLLKSLSLQGKEHENEQEKDNNFFNNGNNYLTASWAQWPDGLTGPMKSAKQKRFADRPWHASSIGELERIEREVERLLKSDGQAIESKFTLTSSKGEFLLGNEEELEGLKLEVVAVEGADEKGTVNKLIDNQMLEGEIEQTFFDEEEEEASDIEDMNDLVAEIEDNLFEPSPSHILEIPQTHPHPHPHPQEPQEQTPIPTEISESDRLVRDLEAKLTEKLKQAESVSNPLIKARIEDVIRQLEDNLKHLRENK